ncbi:MAG: hypothetical protein IPL32_03645 [Chloracidobacterium sp.]|nr:hypothetical protein [Chloracidobacterium sp.]
MAENDFDKTATYASAQDDKTGTYDSHSNISDTYAYAELREREFKSRAHGIAIGDSISLRGQDYVIRGIISEGTGEAVIYKIEDSEGTILALKLYFEFANPKEEPNYETLKEIIGINDPDILRLYDFGARYEHEKFRGKYCYEISQFAVGGDLFAVEDFGAKYTPQFIENVIIKELFKGIKTLHGHKIWHCDLKPANIFYIDRDQTDIVIGDYGSAKYVGVSPDSGKLNEDRAIRKTSTVKGTEVYLSPEQGRGIVSEKNDFYSFGMILLQLLYPEWLCEGSDPRRIDKNKFERISEHQFDSKPLIQFDDRFGRMNTLIQGLTLVYNKNRWGQEEVERWLKGEEVPVKYGGTDAAPVQTVKLGYAEIRTEKDLIKIIETNSDWYKDLFEDEATYRTVRIWLDSYKDIPTRKEVENLVSFYQLHGTLFVREALLRYFEPERPVRIDMDSFLIVGSPNVKKEVDSFLSKLDEIWKITKPETLRFYLFQLEFSLRQREAASLDETKIVVSSLIEKLYAVFGMAQQPFSNFRTELFRQIDPDDEDATFRRLVDLFYAFNPVRNFRDSQNQQIDSLADLGLLYCRSESAFSNKQLNIERLKFLEKIGRNDLQKLKYVPFVFEIFKDNAESHIELMDITFDVKRNYRVSYKFYKSLKNFLSHNGITNDFTSRSDSFEVYYFRRGLFKSFESVADNFIQSVCDKHNIRKLSPNNESQIKVEFIKQSRKRFVYLRIDRSKGKSGKMEKLQADLETADKKVHWRPAALISVFATIGFSLLYVLLAFYAGWIVWDTNTRYLTFNSPVRLDGTNYNKGDFLKVLSQNEFFDCLEIRSVEKCFPTQSLINQKVNQHSTPIETLGKFDYEFKTPRDVFKVTKSFWLKNNKGNRVNFAPGDIVNIRIDNNSWCFNFGAKGGDSCYSPDSKFHDKETFVGTFRDHGSAIKDYRGRNLFTFNRSVTLDGTNFTQGSSWPDASSGSPWVYCVDSKGRKCFPTKNGIDRLKQTDVPVVANSGTIDTRKSDFSIRAAIVLSLFVGLSGFIGALPAAKKFKLFLFRERIGTAKFINMAPKE